MDKNQSRQDLEEINEQTKRQTQELEDIMESLGLDAEDMVETQENLESPPYIKVA